MLPRDIIGTAWQSLGVHRLRTGLSILGIVIGIASFSIMYSVGESAQQKTNQAIQELGADVIQIRPQRSKASDKKKPAARGETLSLRDIDGIKGFCPAVSDVSPEICDSTDFYRHGKKEMLNVTGILPAYEEMFKLQDARGRTISELDLESGHQVCLLGDMAAARIFGNKDPLGEPLAIKGYLFKVIGIINDTGLGMANVKNDILIPLPLAQRLFQSNEIPTLYVRARDTNSAMAELERYFQLRYGDANRFEIRSQKLLLQTQEKNIKIFEYILWTIGSISLLVGGIGIMNIMLVSVTERVREIGIRRALGATKTEIKLQFLCESILLCLVGAMGGTILGFLGARLISYLFRFPPVFSVKLLIIALVIASVLGIVCGTYPAARAANQDPTVVLRYE